MVSTPGNQTAASLYRRERRLEDENRRLRSALQYVVDKDRLSEGPVFEDVARVARKALNGGSV